MGSTPPQPGWALESALLRHASGACSLPGADRSCCCVSSAPTSSPDGSDSCGDTPCHGLTPLSGPNRPSERGRESRTSASRSGFTPSGGRGESPAAGRIKPPWACSAAASTSGEPLSPSTGPVSDANDHDASELSSFRLVTASARPWYPDCAAPAQRSSPPDAAGALPLLPPAALSPCVHGCRVSAALIQSRCQGAARIGRVCVCERVCQLHAGGGQ